MRGQWQSKTGKGGHRKNSYRRKHSGKPEVTGEGGIIKKESRRTESELEKAKRQREKQGRGPEWEE